jgi:hypothetical protein
MPVQLYKTISLSSQGMREPKLARNTSVPVPVPVLRSLSCVPDYLRDSDPQEVESAAQLVDITFRSAATACRLPVRLLGVKCGPQGPGAG